MLAAEKPTKGWITEHLPVGVEVVDHQGGVVLEIDSESMEPGTIPHRCAVDETTNVTITYMTDRPVEKELWYWVGWDGKAYFGYN